uniref:Uncharacterized protein n=1 Tax=Romanomermis culicivorax TaxID=13658 RepID=A0A915K9T3_ROMCU
MKTASNRGVQLIEQFHLRALLLLRYKCWRLLRRRRNLRPQSGGLIEFWSHGGRIFVGKEKSWEKITIWVKIFLRRWFQ